MANTSVSIYATNFYEGLIKITKIITLYEKSYNFSLKSYKYVHKILQFKLNFDEKFIKKI